MSELKKLLEGRPVKILDKNCAEIDGGRYLRSQIQQWADGAVGTAQSLGWRLILHLMDEYEEPEPKDPNRCAVCGWPLTPTTCRRGNCSQRPMPNAWYDPERAAKEGYVNPIGPKPTRKELIAELARQEQADGHYRCDLPEKQDPFTGPHWKLAEADVRAGVYSAICLCDLRDELRRLREEK